MAATRDIDYGKVAAGGGAAMYGARFACGKECPVCKDIIGSDDAPVAILTACGHFLCETCYMHLISRAMNPPCPTCRAPITGNTVRYDCARDSTVERGGAVWSSSEDENDGGIVHGSDSEEEGGAAPAGAPPQPPTAPPDLDSDPSLPIDLRAMFVDRAA